MYLPDAFAMCVLILLTLRSIKMASSSSVDFAQFELFFAHLMRSDLLKYCSVQIYFTSRSDSLQKLSGRISDRLNRISAITQEKLETTGAIVWDVEAPANARKYQQPSHGNLERCSVVIVDTGVVSTEALRSTHAQAKKSMIKTMIAPELNPPTVRNRDLYLVFSEQFPVLTEENSKELQRFKFKIVVQLKSESKNVSQYPFQDDLSVRLVTVCQYGRCKTHGYQYVDMSFLESSTYSSSAIKALFTDNEANFFGHTLRLSTTTKVPQLLEMETLSQEKGRTILKPKRGLYASVLRELSSRLNFTFDIVPSSGSGSTGHALANGSWVGTVGDTYNGLVDFGLMAAITYQRFPYAEFCAPINFAYLGFVTGPPRKSFAWNAIFWSFTPLTWLLILILMIISAGLVSFVTSQIEHTIQMDAFKHLIEKDTLKWSYLKGLSFLGRGLLEQNAPLPKQTSASLKTFVLFWLMFALVCGTAYRSKMVSLLTFPLYDQNPTSFDELAKANEFQIGFHYFGNVGYAYFKSSTNPSFVNIFNRMDKEPNPLKCLQTTLDQRAACIIFIITFQELLYRNLSDQYGKSPLKFIPHEGAMFPAGVIHQFKAPLSSNFKSILFPALESGLIPFWQKSDLLEILKNKNEWQKKSNAGFNLASDTDDSLLRVKNLLGAFVILCSGIVFGTSVFMLEKMRNKIFRATDKKSKTHPALLRSVRITH